jgi:hypothetical protein
MYYRSTQYFSKMLVIHAVPKNEDGTCPTGSSLVGMGDKKRTVIPTGARCVSDDPNNNSSTDRTNYARRNNNTNNTNRTDNTQQDRQHPTEVAVVQAALLVQL